MVSCALMEISWDSPDFTPGDTGDAGEVGQGDDGVESRGFKQAPRGRGLVVAVLEEEPATGLEVGARAGDDGADRGEPVGAAVGEGLAGLEAQVAAAEVRVGGGDVGR